MSDLEAQSQFDKIRKDPLPLIGFGGLIGVVAYSLFNYKNKSKSTKTSVYLIQTRVAAQGLVIGLLTLGLGYRMFNNVIHPENRPVQHENHVPTNVVIDNTHRYK